MIKQRKEILECPNPDCKSKNILTLRNHTRYCRRCGEEWKIEEKKEAKHESP